MGQLIDLLILFRLIIRVKRMWLSKIVPRQEKGLGKILRKHAYTNILKI